MRKYLVILMGLMLVLLMGCTNLQLDNLEECFLNDDCIGMNIHHDNENITHLMKYVQENLQDFNYDTTLIYSKDSDQRYIDRLVLEIQIDDNYTYENHLFIRELYKNLNTVINNYFESIHEGEDLNLGLNVSFYDAKMIIPTYYRYDNPHEEVIFDIEDFDEDLLDNYCLIIKQLYQDYPEVHYKILYETYPSIGMTSITQYIDGSELVFEIDIYGIAIFNEESLNLQFFIDVFSEYEVVFKYS